MYWIRLKASIQDYIALITGKWHDSVLSLWNCRFYANQSWLEKKETFLFIDNSGSLSGLVGGRERDKKGLESPGPKQQWCQHCKVVVLGNGVRKITKDVQGKAQVWMCCFGMFRRHSKPILFLKCDIFPSEM